MLSSDSCTFRIKHGFMCLFVWWSTLRLMLANESRWIKFGMVERKLLLTLVFIFVLPKSYLLFSAQIVIFWNRFINQILCTVMFHRGSLQYFLFFLKMFLKMHPIRYSRNALSGCTIAWIAWLDEWLGWYVLTRWDQWVLHTWITCKPDSGCHASL